MNTTPSIHLIIPAYNEAARLPYYLASLCPALAEAEFSCVLRVVDDGSEEKEATEVRLAVEKLSARFPFLVPVHRLSANGGKGAAIRAGWNLLEPSFYQAFVDADGAIPAREVVRMIRAALTDGGTTSFYASRIRMLGRKIERNELRHYSGRVFASLVGAWIDSGVYDSQCGFKLVHVDTWKRIAPNLQENGFLLDVELLAWLRQEGFPVVEFPIDWTDQNGSKVSLWRDSWRMFSGLCRLRDRLPSATK